jgi:hypothetical protein
MPTVCRRSIANDFSVSEISQSSHSALAAIAGEKKAKSRMHEELRERGTFSKEVFHWQGCQK